MNLKKITYLVFFSIILLQTGFSQLFYINGADIKINGGAIVSVDGSVENTNTGDLSNDGSLYISNDFTNNALTGGNGSYYLSGNWINNNNFNPGLSTVYLEGGAQNISGTISTTFNNLDLNGTGIKQLAINTSCDGILALNDRELATGTYVMSVLSTNINAITRTTGFVSSTGNGNLLRATSLSSNYLFPVGSSLGTQRYRPVEITPASTALNTYSVEFINNDASSDGYDRALLDTNICAANPDFYHRINRVSGTDAADIAIFYDELSDGLWEGVAQWDVTPSTKWTSIANIVNTLASPLNNNMYASWNDFSTDPYILTMENPTVDLGPDTFVCDNSYITINAGAGFDTYTWSTGQTGVEFIDITVPDTYSVTVTSQGCTAIDTVKVLLKTAPTADAGENMGICAGDTLTLTASGGISYEWMTTETTQSIDVSPIVTTTYWVTVSDGFCFDDDSVVVTVTPSPIADAGIDQVICIGDSAVLTASGGTSYEWSTTETTASIEVYPTSNTSYIVTVSENGCSDLDTVNVSVVNSVIADAGIDQTICTGDSINLTASGGGTFLWNTTETTATINVSPLTTTIYYVTVSAGSCEDTDSVTVNVISAPVAFAGNDTTICEGATISLTANGGGSYLWSTGSTNQSTDVSPVSTTTYYVTVSNSGCSDTDNVTVTVNAAPSANAGTDQTICTGNDASLSASGGISYQWNTGDNTQMIVVTPSLTTNYTVTVIDGNGCTDTDEVMVTVVAAPVANAGLDLSVCQGDSVQLNAIGGPTYHWEPSAYVTNANIGNPYAFPVNSGNFIVLVSNGICSDEDTVFISVSPAPTVNAGNDTSIYIGDYASLNATNVSGFIYQWSPPTYLDNPYVYNPVSEPDQNITYILTVTDTNNCSNTDQVTIHVIEKPILNIVIYNTITPNGDLYNDFWIIENIEQYPESVIEVYNRNGHVVFESKNYQNDWDGKYYGNDLPAATYYYVIDLGDGSDIYKGDLTIIR